MSNQHELEQTTTVPIRRRVALSGHLSAPEHTTQPPPVVATPPRAAFHLYLSQHARLTTTYEPQMNDMLSGGPAPSGRSALEQMGELVCNMPGAGLPECCSACWGAPFSSGRACSPHFIPGKLHFKNKFCAGCRTCILVPL